MKKNLLAFAILFVGAQFTAAQINSTKLKTKQPVQYQKAEFDIDLTAQWSNPYLQEDVMVDMLIEAPSGKKLTLPCYYESGESGKLSIWKARFTPQEAGKYKYSFLLAANGKEKSFSSLQHFNALPSEKNGFLHPESNWVLKFDNGKLFRGIGENICWESRASDDSRFYEKLHENSKYNYNYLLPLLASNGGNFYRAWICAWNFPIDWKRGFNSNRYTPSDEYFNPSAVRKLDSMVNLADSLGLYIMLTLGPGAYGPRDGGFSKTAADFFVNPASKERYRNRLRYIIARWGYSTSVCAWELFNEVDNVQFSNKEKPISADSIVQWHDEMSSYIKKTDPYDHLVTTSISHRDLKGLNTLPHIDFNQKHIYRNTSAIPSAIVQYENDFKKPYVIGEYSFEWDWSKNFDDFAVDMDTDFKRGLWYGLFSPTPILPMSWWWEYFENRGMMTYFKGVKEINDQMLEAGKGSFTQIPVEADSLDAYGVKCGNNVFVYIFNRASSAFHSDISVKIPGQSSYKSQSFTPASREYKDLGMISSGSTGMIVKNLELKPKDELVIIFRPH